MYFITAAPVFSATTLHDGQVLLLFGQVADLPGSGVVLLGDIGYDFLLLSSQAV